MERFINITDSRFGFSRIINLDHVHEIVVQDDHVRFYNSRGTYISAAKTEKLMEVLSKATDCTPMRNTVTIKADPSIPHPDIPQHGY